MKQGEHRPRVVVTGIGALTPMGNSVQESWAQLIQGESGIGPITHFDASPFETRFAAEVKDFQPEAWMERRDVRRTDRYVQFAMASVRQAIADAKLDFAHINRERVGVVIGTSIGGIETLFENYDKFKEKGWRRVSPFFLTGMICDAAGAQVAIDYNLRGPSIGIVSACASGANAIGEATEMIRRGMADVMIAGGSEASVMPIALAAFNVMRALSTRNESPTTACRPFDDTRDGFVLGEGSAVVILEHEAHALARGATIYGEVIGYGSTVDGYHLSQPAENGQGLQAAMRMALDMAEIDLTEVDYINAHGTGTPLNDVHETRAIKGVFGENAYDIPVSSTKSMTGHLIGAAGSFELVACLKAIETGIIPPTINLYHPDAECDLDYVPNVARQHPVRVALSNSMGLGGHNACLLVRQYS